MPELRAEETRLCTASVSSAQQQPSMLAATPSQVSSLPPSFPPSLVAARTSSGVLCGYCKRLGHDEWACHKKRRDWNRKGGCSSTLHATRSVSAAEHEILALFRRHYRSADLSTGDHCSGIWFYSYSSSSMYKWFLGSSVSFHMTLDSTHLSSMLYPDSPFIVQTVDGTSLPIAGCGILSTSSFHVPSFLHIPKLAMHLMCASQITDHDCRIILDVDSRSPTGASVGLGIMILMAFRNFTGCVFLHPLYLSTRPVLLPLCQLHRITLLLCSVVI